MTLKASFVKLKTYLIVQETQLDSQNKAIANMLNSSVPVQTKH